MVRKRETANDRVKMTDIVLSLHTAGFAVVFQVCTKVTILFYLFDVV